MKTQLLLASLLLLVLCGCNDTLEHIVPKNDSSTISVISDVTDPMPKPKSDEILNLTPLTDDTRYNGFEIRYAPISDVSLSPVKEFNIDPTNWFVSNDLERTEQLKKLRDSFATWYTQTTKPVVAPKKFSLVYGSMARELNFLADKKNTKTRIALVVSDLAEHSLMLDSYSPEGIRQLKTNPQTLAARFEKEMPLKPLNGIRVYFLYQPGDYASQQRYDLTSQFFKTLLERHGAIVIISAGLEGIEQ